MEKIQSHLNENKDRFSKMTFTELKEYCKKWNPKNGDDPLFEQEWQKRCDDGMYLARKKFFEGLAPEEENDVMAMPINEHPENGKSLWAFF